MRHILEEDVKEREVEELIIRFRFLEFSREMAQ
jgi:hypothetical protein